MITPHRANEMKYSLPRLCLAAGVTPARTTGSTEPYTDLQVKDDTCYDSKKLFDSVKGSPESSRRARTR